MIMINGQVDLEALLKRAQEIAFVLNNNNIEQCIDNEIAIIMMVIMDMNRRKIPPEGIMANFAMLISLHENNLVTRGPVN